MALRDGRLISLVLAAFMIVALNLPGAAQTERAGDSGISPDIRADLDEAKVASDADPKRAMALTKRILQQLDQGGDPSLRVEALALSARSHSRLARYNEALDIARQAVQLAEDSGVEDGSLAMALDAMGRARLRLGRLSQSLQAFQRAHNIREGLGLKTELVTSLTNIASLHALASQFDRAIVYFSQARNLAEELGQDQELSRILINLSYTYIESGQPEAALVELQEARRLIHELDNPLLMAHAYHNSGEAMYLAGRFEESEEYLQQALELTEELGMRSVHADNLYYLSRIRLRQDRLDEAGEFADAALAIAEETDEDARLRDIHLVQSELAEARGDYVAALAHFKEHEDYKEHLQNNELTQQIRLMEADFELRRKDQEIELLRRDSEIQSLRLDKQQTFRRAAIFSGVVLIGVIAALSLWLHARVKAAQALEQKTVALKETQKELERANQAKSDILAMTSHEIRTPLNGIMGMADLLLRTPLNDVQKRQAETIRSAGDTLLAIVNDILDLSKIEAGRVDIDEVEFNFSRLTDSLESLWRPRAEDKGLVLNLEIDTAIPPKLIGDSKRVQQVLANLVTNAIKFTNEGEVGVSVRQIGTDDAPVLRFEVTDTGPGIPADVQRKIFEPFMQADSGMSRDHSGSGLGLAICQRLIEVMGGRIGLESESGQGSTFWFEIPLRPSKSANGDVAPLDEATSRGAGYPVHETTGPIRILVAEDNHLNQAVIEGMLDRPDFHVWTVSDGNAAVEHIRAGNIDIVLMDVHMPGMDGLTATLEIRRLPAPKCHVPIVALTADAMIGDREKMLNSGMDDYVAKPIDPQILEQVIHKHTGVRQKQSA